MGLLIYRSTTFDYRTKWNYPLVAVEVIVAPSSHVRTYVYDIGFAPPYWDLSSHPGLLSPLDPPYTLEKGIKYLQDMGIYATNWVQVNNYLYNEHPERMAERGD